MKIEMQAIPGNTDHRVNQGEHGKKGVLTDATAQNRTVSGAFLLGSPVPFLNQGQTYTKTQGKDDLTELLALDTNPYDSNLEYMEQAMSASDYEEAMQDGFSMQKDDADQVVTEMDKIKMQLAKAGKPLVVFGDGISAQEVMEQYGSQAIVQMVEQALKEAGMPATEENVRDLQAVLGMGAQMEDISEGSMRYILENELMPTVENIYQAQYSGSMAAATGAPVLPEGLETAVNDLLSQAGLSQDEENITAAAWLLQENIDLTAGNINYKKELGTLSLPLIADDILNAGIAALKQGGRPQDAVLLAGASFQERAAAAAEVVAKADETTVGILVEEGKDLTIENLEWALGQQEELEAEQTAAGAQGSLTSKYNADALPPEKAGELLVKTRQLQEIRLVMTVEASYTLIKQGIQIEIKPLADLVDKLREAELQFYKDLLGDTPFGDEVIGALEGRAAAQSLSVQAEYSQVSYSQTTTITVSAAQVMYETAQTVAGLKEAPADAVAAEGFTTQPLQEAGEQAAALKHAYEEANKSYETMMTEPRKDLGDRIETAFRNIQDILDDMGLPATESNERAVRILGYNSMEITYENITEVKTADAKVQRMFSGLTPSVVLEMIREGKNPLHMSIEELNAVTEQIREAQEAQTDEKYSQYLWKLEQSNSITAEERSAYIGVYRLLHQVGQTDGAAIGALVQQNVEPTMKNLLSAVRTGRRAGMDVSIDETTGENTGKAPENSISAQIEAAFQTECSKAVFSKLDPENMGGMMRDGAYNEMTPEQMLEALQQGAQQEADSKQAASARDYAQSQIELLQTIKGDEEQVIQQLTQHEMPKTLYNMLAAHEMRHQRNKTFQQIFSSDHYAGQEDFKEACNELLERYAEAAAEPEELAKAQEELAEVAENVLKNAVAQEETTSLDIRDLRVMNSVIALSTRQAREEHYNIPVMVGGEVTNVSLKIVRGTKEKGRVNLAFETANFGKVAVQVKVSAQRSEAVAVVGRTEGKEWMQGIKQKLTDILGSAGAGDAIQDGADCATPRSVGVQIVESASLELNRFMEDGAGKIPEEQDAETYQVQTSLLYGIAKEIIAVFKL